MSKDGEKHWTSKGAGLPFGMEVTQWLMRHVIRTGVWKAFGIVILTFLGKEAGKRSIPMVTIMKSPHRRLNIEISPNCRCIHISHCLQPDGHFFGLLPLANSPDVYCPFLLLLFLSTFPLRCWWIKLRHPTFELIFYSSSHQPHPGAVFLEARSVNSSQKELV